MRRDKFNFINYVNRLESLLVAEQSVSFVPVQTPTSRNGWRPPAMRFAANTSCLCAADDRQDDRPALPDDAGLVIAQDGTAYSAIESGSADPASVIRKQGCSEVPSSGASAKTLTSNAVIDCTGDLAQDLVNAQPHLLWATGANGLTEYRNHRWHDFAGDTGDATRWTAILHPAEQALAWAKWQQHLVSGDPYESEHRLRRRDGAYRWALARAVAVRGADGAIARWCGTFTDIHALKTNESQLDFLAGELTHRIGNIFAVVESMLMLSSRNQPEAQEFATNACARIRALAQANAYIRPQHGSGPDHKGSSLHGLLATLLAPYQPGSDAQMPATVIEMSGPDVPLGASTATVLALVIHELATNAAKYGALACAGGQLSVVTSLENEILQLVWRETGGPALAGPPTRNGFGSVLTDRALRLPLGARVERVWAASGLSITISVERERLAL